MKRGLSYLIICSLLFGCTPSPYIKSIQTVYESPTKSGNEIDQKYYDRISDSLKNSLSNNDLIVDFWQTAIIATYDSNTIIDSGIMSLLEEKEKAFNNELLVECNKILIDGIKKTGNVPKENNITLLKYEIFKNCSGDAYKESISNQTFNEIDNKINSFYKPMLSKISDNAKNNHNKLVYIYKGDSSDIPFVDVYVNIYKYSEQEKYKLEKLMDIYKLYNDDALKAEILKLGKSLNDKQLQLGKKFFSSMENKNNKEIENNYKAYIATLNNEQLFIWNKTINMAKYAAILNKTITERLHKYKETVEWLKINKDKAESSLTHQDTIRAERAKAITSALVIGLAGGLSAYGSYLLRPRPQTIIQQPTMQQPQMIQPQNPQFMYDSQGKTYYLYK